MPAMPHEGLGEAVPVPAYDEGLLERLRHQWRQGQWADMAAISLDAIERHPERDRLALMLAAAHQALGHAAQTKTLSRLAIQWGADETLVARVLLAGIHNMLARASVASGKHMDRALYHFGEAIAPGSSRTARWLATQARAKEQLAQLSMGHEFARLFGLQRAGAIPIRPLAPTPFRELSEGLKAQNDQIKGQFSDHSKQLTNLRNHLEFAVKKELGNAVKQLEAHSALQRYLGRDHRIPEFHGWPISPDFGLLLLSLLEQGDFDLIVEFGSGSSTLLMAVAMSRAAAARRGRGAPPTRLLTLEHLEEYRRQTAALLSEAGLEGDVDLALAPIEPLTLANGETVPYYAAGSHLVRMHRELASTVTPRILLMVDGPPSATGPLARYPALPLVMRHFPRGKYTVLLDDYFREEEKKIAQRWQSELEAQGISVEFVVKPLEKEACILTFEVGADECDRSQ